MNIVAYCRVSTEKTDQLNSLEMQKQFFEEYAIKEGHKLVRVYADEGLSGTKLKNRKELLHLLRDAKLGLFEMVITKDISRLARNTVDFLNSIRQLKELNIETLFLTSNMTVLGNSEFSLTIFAAMAQEESANTSKRVKFGKQRNAEKGRVPNIVYGYDKTIGDYFNLSINKDEAAIVRRIFDMYVNQGFGASKISIILNEEGLKTKRGSAWSQNAIARLLKNEIYIGRIINGKEEVENFLTGKRKIKDEMEWKVIERPDLRIIELDLFDKAQDVLAGRIDAFNINHERQSSKHLFSTLIKCPYCGYSFRRTVHTYKNTYIRWVCSGRNTKGTGSCINKITVDEAELKQSMREYFTELLGDKPLLIKNIKNDFIKTYKTKDDNEYYENDLTDKLVKLRKDREKTKEMFKADVISNDEMREDMSKLNAAIEKIEKELSLISYNLDKSDQLEDILFRTFKTVEDIVSIETLTNAQLKEVIKKIVVDSEGNADIYLRLFGDIGLDETSLITYNYTYSVPIPCRSKVKADWIIEYGK